ncbi:MAG: DMT family transporter [Aeromicrobium sp.]|uniref:DMT family transporter n=1 Tax=Aeromicrobium sp. TaxID=1871063 RepID=UPI0039E6F483
MNWVVVVVALCGVSSSGPLMAATAAPAPAIAFWRNASSAAVLVPLAGSRCREELRALSARGWRLAVVAGATLALHFAAWVGSLKLTSVAAATALMSTQLVWVLLIDRIRGVASPVQAVLGSTLAVVGVLVVSGFDFQVSTEALLGDALAVASGFFAALYLLAGGAVRTELTTTAYTAVCYAVCALVLLAGALAHGDPLVGFSGRDWLLIAAVTVFAQFLGHSLFNHLLAVTSPMVVALLLLLEVPFAALLAAVFLGEAAPGGVYAGLALILVGLAVVVTRRRVEPSVARAPLPE